MSCLKLPFSLSKLEALFQAPGSYFSKQDSPLSPVKVENDSEDMIVSVTQSLCCGMFHTDLKLYIHPSDVPAPVAVPVVANEKIYDSIEKGSAQKEVQSEQTSPEPESLPVESPQNTTAE